MIELSENARAKLSGANFAYIATLMQDGSPHVAPVWVDLAGGHVLVNTIVGSVKDRNVRRDPRVALSVAERTDPYDKLDLRGRVVEITEGEPAARHLSALAVKYTGQPYEVSPDDRLAIFRIEPHAAYEETWPDLSGQTVEMAEGELGRSSPGVKEAAHALLAALIEAGSADDFRALALLFAGIHDEAALRDAEAALR